MKTINQNRLKIDQKSTEQLFKNQFKIDQQINEHESNIDQKSRNKNSQK